MPPGDQGADFDQFVGDYSSQVEKAIGLPGNRHEFFIERKVEVLREVARDEFRSVNRARILDVGCGIGLFERRMQRDGLHLYGADISMPSLVRARQGEPHATFCRYDGWALPFLSGTFDVAFTACVIHHVPLTQRRAFVREMARVVRQGGLIVVFEHNPWNPITRWVVSRCPFDRDAVLLGPRRLSRLLESADLELEPHRYFLLWPWAGMTSRRLERWLQRLPFGAQYVAAGRVAHVTAPVGHESSPE